MSHSLNKVWIHGVWATKHRKPLIKFNIENKVYALLRKELQDVGCYVEIINGMPDHVHTLFLLNRTISISDVFKQMKGGSSHAIKQSDFLEEKFAWQTGFAAFSVSESAVQRVYQYIKNQKEHHLKKSFQEEYAEFLKYHGLKDSKTHD